MHSILRYVLSGMAIGLANLIPGVSGGTLAVILNVYDPLVESIPGLLTSPERRREYLLFLCQIGIGAVISIFLFASFITFFIEHYPQPTFLFFIGLIVGSLPMVYHQHSQTGPSFLQLCLFCVSGISVVALGIAFPGDLGGTNLISTGSFSSLLLFGFSGFIAAAAMVIPGLSGSFILLLLGTYATIIEAVSSLHWMILFYVSTGAILGIFSLAKLMDHCIKRFPSSSYALILGLMVGSVLPLWPGLQLDLLGAVSLVFGGLGIYISYLLSK